METLKRVFAFYINGSVHVALSIVALVQISFFKFGVSEGTTYLYFAFFGSIVAYNFVKYIGADTSKPRSQIKQKVRLRALTLICVFVFLYLSIWLSFEIVLYTLPFAVLTFLYAVPILPFKNNLRNINGLKIFVIGLTWTGVTALIPAFFAENGWTWDMVIEIVQRFLLIIVWMLPFEIRDLQYDKESLGTIPQRLGIVKTKLLGSVLLVVFLVLTAIKQELYVVEILGAISVALITLLFLWSSEEKQSTYFSSFWVESIPLIWLLVWILLQLLFG